MPGFTIDGHICILSCCRNCGSDLSSCNLFGLGRQSGVTLLELGQFVGGEGGD